MRKTSYHLNLRLEPLTIWIEWLPAQATKGKKYRSLLEISGILTCRSQWQQHSSRVQKILCSEIDEYSSNKTQQTNADQKLNEKL